MASQLRRDVWSPSDVSQDVQVEEPKALYPHQLLSMFVCRG